MDDRELGICILNAMNGGDLDEVKKLFNTAPAHCMAMLTPFGTWLHVAADVGHLEIVRWLVSNGADVNMQAGMSNANALHSAASEGYPDVVSYLLEEGAQMDVSSMGRNPLFSAIVRDHPDVAKRLIESGIDTTVNYSGTTALSRAREWGRTSIVEMLDKD